MRALDGINSDCLTILRNLILITEPAHSSSAFIAALKEGACPKLNHDLSIFTHLIR